MDRVKRAVEPIGAVLHAARRPGTYRGHVTEALSTAVTAGMWPLGFASFGDDDGGEPDDPTTVTTPVLLLHGYGANKSNWLYVRRYLNQAGFERVHAFNYNPFAADIPGLADQCVARAEELKDRFGTDRVHLIGHSLGGIIARYAVQVAGAEGVGVCITVVSPHGGVRLASYRSPVAKLSPMASGFQLRPQSSVLRALRSTARPLPTRFVAYYSNLDLVVPARRAMIVEPELAATNILVKDHGHLSIMLSRQLASSVVDQLAADEHLPGYGAPLRSLAGAEVRRRGEAAAPAPARRPAASA